MGAGSPAITAVERRSSEDSSRESAFSTSTIVEVKYKVWSIAS